MVKKNIDIECLRAVAIVLTLVAHIPTLLPYPSGLLNFLMGYIELSVGVDLFFVISGFVITQSLLGSEASDAQGRGRKIMSFWVRRAFRLMPVAVLWLVILGVYFYVYGDFRAMLKPLFAAGLNVMNWYSAYCVSNPGDSTICSYFPHGHYWSLSLEEQFYLIYPFLFFFVPRRFLLGIIIGAIAVQLFWNRPVWTYGWFFRADALCWGVLLGICFKSSWYQKLVPTLNSASLLGVAIGALLVGVMLWVGAEYTGFGEESYTFGVGLVAIAGAVLVWLASYDRNFFSYKGWFRTAMTYVGARSYSLYVSHLIIFTIFAQRVDTNLLLAHGWSERMIKLVALVVGLGGSFIASELTYRYLETPARDFGRSVTKRWQAKDCSRIREPRMMLPRS